MHFLYIDSTNGLTIGLLDKDYNWLHLENLEEKKPSEVVHKKIHNLCEKFQVDIKQSSLIIAAGPGSYTGMRLGEGIAHILKIAGIKIYSFYHFEVPKLIGIESGRFVTNAFKGQYFIYDWSKDSQSNFLMNAEDLNLSQEVFIILEDLNFKNGKSTKKLIAENSKVLFESVVKRDLYLNSYYFRAIDEEFKPIC